MKLTLHIHTAHPEEVIVYADKKTALVESIEQLIENEKAPLMGYANETAVPLQLSDVHCIFIENNRTFAKTDTQTLLLKQRLYQIEERLPDNFVKINQSCIANIAKIKRFDSSVTGTLSVLFKNGYKDYVSRRNLKTVKERLGL